MSRAQRVAYLGGSFSIGVFAAFNNFTLTLWLATFTASYLLLGLMGNTRSFEGTIVSPLIGVWSDRVWAGWLGRRRAFILAGGLLSALLLALTPAISRWPLPAALAGLPPTTAALVLPVAIIFLFTITFNSMDDVHKALLVDVTTEEERNTLSAWSVVVLMAGQVGILVLGFALWRDGVPDSAFALTALLMAAGVLLCVLGVREPPPAAWAADRRREAAAEGPRPSALTLLRLYKGAALFCLVGFAYWSGVNAVLPLVSVYTRDILGASVGEAQLLPSLMLLSTTLCALPMARLGDRYGKRRIIAAGYAVMAAAALAALVITTREQGALVFLLAGVGNGASMVLTVPLLADLVPRPHVGAATGILAASGSVAAPFASLLAGALADVYGPRAIFAFMAVMILLALALLPAVRPPAALAAPIAPPSHPGAQPLEALSHD
ncbi:MAG TPA: MFS transporter [Chloroflexota bacterium]|nr:MFS transporter [Chloroflexota bacterium]